MDDPLARDTAQVLTMEASVAVPQLHRLVAPYRELDRRIWILAAARCINTMGFSIVMPFMAMYLVEQRGAKGATYGAIYLAAGVGAAVSQGLAGEASDRYGRRRVMVTALCLRAANMILLGLAVTRGASLNVIGGLIVSNGVLRAMFEPCASAAVTDLSPAGHRVAAFGLQRIGVNLGWSMGPALGGAFAHHSYGALFFFAAPVTLIAALAALRVRDGARPPPETAAAEPMTIRAVLATLRANRAFVAYLFLVFAAAVMTTQLFSTLSVFAKTELGFSEGRIGLIYTVNGAMVVLLQVPAVALIKRGGARVALVLGPAIYTLAYLALGVTTSFSTVALAVAFLTFGEVIFSPALSDTAAHLGDPRRLGRAFGLFGLMQSAGVSVGPLVGGIVFDHLRDDHFAMWATLAAGMALVGLGYAAFSRRHEIRLD